MSVAHVDGEEMAVFSHGRAQRMQESDPDWDETLGHWTAHYGSSPLEWGDEVCVYRYRAALDGRLRRQPVRAARGPRHRHLTPALSPAAARR